MMITLSRHAHRIARTCACLLVFSALGCDSTDPDVLIDSSTTVLVANQGNFADGNGSITAYDPESGQVSVVLTRPSSIIQSIAIRSGLIYVAMNTGDRIDVIDVARGLVGQVVDIPSPRYMAWSDTDRLLVSNLFDNTVTVVDMTSSLAVGQVDVGPNPEGIAVHNGFAYVANHGFGAGTTVSVVDVSTSQVSRTMDIDCDGPRFLFFDSQDEMWTICTGQTIYDQDFNVTGTTDGAVVLVDPTSGEATTRFDLDGMVSTAGPGQDAFFSRQAETLFVVVEGDRIVQLDTASNRVVAVIGPLAGAPIGSVAFDDVDGRLYVGRVPGFAQSGQVTILGLDGTVVGEFSAGVAPSHIEILRVGG